MDNTKRILFSPPDFALLRTLGGIGIAAQLYLLCDSQGLQALDGFCGGVLFSRVGSSRALANAMLLSAGSRGGAPEGPAGVGIQARDKVYVRSAHKRECSRNP